MSDDVACIPAEAAFLGCMLRAPRLHQLGFSQQVEVEDFADPRHRIVFEALRANIAHGPADPVTVLGELRRTGAAKSFLADKDAGIFLVELCEAAPAHSSIGHYLQIVLEHRARRRLAEAAERLAQAAGTIALADLGGLLANEYVEVCHQLTRSEERRLAEAKDNEDAA